MSRLYIVSTPIGNLGDITFRAVEVLGSVRRVLAEDTRRTSILFRRYDIHTPLVSAHEHNEAARAEALVRWLDDGDDIAFVTDAGTPLLSDPGARLVRAVVAAGHTVVPIPGPSALLAALVTAGMEPEPFTFYGFLPRSGRDRRTRVAEIAALRHVAILYESPARLRDLLDELAESCGVERPLSIARELTKLHETVFRGTIDAARRYYAEDAVRGEVVVVVGGASVEPPSVEDAASMARALLDAGETPRNAARELARRLQLSRNEAYSLVLSVTGESPQEKDRS